MMATVFEAAVIPLRYDPTPSHWLLRLQMVDFPYLIQNPLKNKDN
jgi:hypothetical protein